MTCRCRFMARSGLTPVREIWSAIQGYNRPVREHPDWLQLTLMHRAQLWTVFAPTPAPVGTGAGRTVHNYRACRNFLRSSGG
jgi:hypothetical protein